MKAIITSLILLLGVTFITSCNKATIKDIPISFTDKDGDVFIQIDNVSKTFDAYSSTKIGKGLLKGLFNDTIRSAFYLAIKINPYWDTTYHAGDTVIFTTHYPSHATMISSTIDLSKFSSPYHFLLLGLSETDLKSGSFGKPTIELTIDTNNQ